MCYLLTLLTPILGFLVFVRYLLCQLGGGSISCAAEFYVTMSFGVVGTCGGVTVALLLLQYCGGVEFFPTMLLLQEV